VDAPHNMPVAVQCNGMGCSLMVSEEMKCTSGSCEGKRFCSAVCYWETHVGSNALHAPPDQGWSDQWWQTRQILEAAQRHPHPPGFFARWVKGVPREEQADTIENLAFVFRMLED
jgi:hypothetical protein